MRQYLIPATIWYSLLRRPNWLETEGKAKVERRKWKGESGKAKVENGERGRMEN